MNSWRRRSTKTWMPSIALAVVTATLSGCQGARIPDSLVAFFPSALKSEAQAPKKPVLPKQEPVREDPVSQFVIQAASGSPGNVVGSDGINLEVVAAEPYHAASGRVCRPYSATSANGQRVDRLLCRNANGRWQHVERVTSPPAGFGGGS